MRGCGDAQKILFRMKTCKGVGDEIFYGVRVSGQPRLNGLPVIRPEGLAQDSGCNSFAAIGSDGCNKVIHGDKIIPAIGFPEAILRIDFFGL